MSKKIYILLLLAAVFFTACSTVQNVPIDDAYYSPAIEKPAIIANPSGSNSSTSSTTPSAPSTSVEYINVQDTTVTVRIKK